MIKKFNDFVGEGMMGKGRNRDIAIAPLGSVNLLTGECKYFNVYDTWGENTTYEFWEDTESKKIKIVATSGKKPLSDIGKSDAFVSDQSRRFLFTGKLIDFAVGSKLKDMVAKYGKSLTGYTYK